MKSVLRSLSRLALHDPVRAAIIIFWFATRRRVRARGQLADAYARLPFRLDEWLDDCAQRDRASIEQLSDIELSRKALTVHLHVDAANESDAAAAVASVIGQSWIDWQFVITRSDEVAQEFVERLAADHRISLLPEPVHSQAQAVSAALEAASHDYLIPLRQFCRLPKHALLAYVAGLSGVQLDDQAVLYADQAAKTAGEKEPVVWFKPGFDPDMLLAQDYISTACALPVASARMACQSCTDELSECALVYTLLLQLAIGWQKPVRQLHRVTAETPCNHWRHACVDRITALRSWLSPVSGVEVCKGPFGTAQLRWPLPATPPLVSIIIPTRDRLDLLQPCLDGVLAQTTYPNFEVIIADNGSIEAATKAYFDHIANDPRVRLVSWPFPYNYSAINNFAAKSAHGDFICLLNNDIEIINGEWLSNLMRHACREGTGAVGARLLYPDRSIQHAGVAVGLGNAAGHAHRGLAIDEPGYFAHSLIAREATAVTAACLVVSRKQFDAVGGLDEDNLRIAYNDVDLCLKLRAAGARNIYEPNAVLVHHESKSRGLDMAPENLERYLKELAHFQEKWATKVFVDPTHHPVLNRSSEIYYPSKS